VTGNTAASVRGRLTNLAKAGQRPFQEVLQRCALERLLYRLAQSPHRARFLLKGALLLNAWVVLQLSEWCSKRKNRPSTLL
jgi:hypothetical protein